MGRGEREHLRVRAGMQAESTFHLFPPDWLLFLVADFASVPTPGVMGGYQWCQGARDPLICALALLWEGSFAPNRSLMGNTSLQSFRICVF